MKLFLLAGAALVVIAAARYWRIAIWSALILAVYEGALRKWFFPQYQEYIFFVKDALLLGAYVGGFWAARMMRGRRVFDTHIANAAIAALAAVCVAQILNPRLPNITVGIYGLQGYLFYIPLMYLVPEVIPDEASARRFVLGILIVSAVPLLLGPIQFSLPPDHALNAYAWSDIQVATFGENENLARVTSTFSYITGFSVFLSIIAPVLLAAALIASGRLRVLLFAVLALVIANQFMTGSRAPLVVTAVSVPIVVSLSARNFGARAKQAIAASLALPLVLILASYLFPEAQQAFKDRAFAAGDFTGRVVEMVERPFSLSAEAGVAGWGIGSTMPAAALFLADRGNHSDPVPGVEAEFDRIVVEIGVFGLLLMLIVRVLVAVGLLQSLRRLPTTSARPLIAAALAIAFTNIPGSLVANRTSSLFYWFAAGICFVPAKWGRSQRTTYPGIEPAHDTAHDVLKVSR